jgi:hypothetical protein
MVRTIQTSIQRQRYDDDQRIDGICSFCLQMMTMMWSSQARPTMMEINRQRAKITCYISFHSSGSLSLHLFRQQVSEHLRGQWNSSPHANRYRRRLALLRCFNSDYRWSHSNHRRSRDTCECIRFMRWFRCLQSYSLVARSVSLIQ